MQKKPVKFLVLAIAVYFVVIAMKKTVLVDKTEEIDLLARTIWGEARGEGVTGMQAVANVVINRVKAGIWYGASIKDVVLKTGQFSCWTDSDPNKEKLLHVTKDNVAFSNALFLADLAIKDELPDITYGANHYHASYVRPYWADDSKKTTQIGNHIFYKL